MGGMTEVMYIDVGRKNIKIIHSLRHNGGSLVRGSLLFI
jgi:hypothetical protein